MKHIVRSIPNKGKLKNGDNFNFFEDETIIIASVADGVGGNACDWKASEQACQDLVYFYLNDYRHCGCFPFPNHSAHPAPSLVYRAGYLRS